MIPNMVPSILDLHNLDLLNLKVHILKSQSQMRSLYHPDLLHSYLYPLELRYPYLLSDVMR
ncbi:unnamed protein product [Citrullus colocynthis]|uniref:Uncharacterized protein n=1 Tax=Citrullus colocynthis TaxID=252529 RepID=A0ABP0YE27_9ROSI